MVQIIECKKCNRMHNPDEKCLPPFDAEKEHKELIKHLEEIRSFTKASKEAMKKDKRRVK